MAKQRMMLFFGSFNPIHNGHIALAEYAVEHKLCDQVAMIISPRNPFKQSWAQAAETDRYEMVELACKASKYPEQIVPSVIEFLLPKPSYTVNTLRHLTENYGSQMEFSILMGSDLINQLPRWKDAQEIIQGYDLYVYPRPGHEVKFTTARTTFLSDAPQFPHSSTDVREALERNESVERMVATDVEKYIRSKALWSLGYKLTTLTTAITQEPDNADLYVERGKCYFRQNEWGKAINDFHKAEELAPGKTDAKQFLEMSEEILDFRYKDIYNP
jgi:nicotinate-nucleotide adenylyltransferase